MALRAGRFDDLESRVHGKRLAAGRRAVYLQSFAGRASPTLLRSPAAHPGRATFNDPCTFCCRTCAGEFHFGSCLLHTRRPARVNGGHTSVRRTVAPPVKIVRACSPGRALGASRRKRVVACHRSLMLCCDLAIASEGRRFSQLGAEAESFAACAASADFRRGIAAFRENRAPRFTGR